jgi:sugar/nucleoside kinase (ribokinase family)
VQPEATFDVCGIGNALVDVLAHGDYAFVERLGLRLGQTIVDEELALRVYDALGPTTEVSGGSVANSAAGIASFGGSVAFFGRRRNDQLGDFFAHDMRSVGVAIPNAPAETGAPTGRCIVTITPDGERTMCTALGAAREMAIEDIDFDVVAASGITFLEGYQFGQPLSRIAMRAAAEHAHANGRQVAFSTCDAWCVREFRDEILDIVEHEIDILFANELEIRLLYGVDTFDEAMQAVNHHCEVAVLTRSEKGSVIVTDDEVHVLDAEPLAEIVDSTGAGDQFAGGFLFGYTQGYDVATSGRLGALAAAEVLSHVGARPQRPLKEFLAGFDH